MTHPTVMVVDDSLTVRMDLAEALGAAGLRALPCDSVAGARAALAAHDVGLVVLDVQLPDGDGVELMREIRAMPGHAATPVLLLSTQAAVQDRIRGLMTGSDDFVGKPYDRDYVVARARDLLARHGGARAQVPGASVLVIDDSPTFREALSEALKGQGYRVLQAASGEEGLRCAARDRPAAIIVDGVMPGIDGPTVVRKLRLDAALRHTPCMLLTGSSTDLRTELAALDAGADAFVRKQDDMELVLARVAAVLRNAPAPGADFAPDSLLGPKKILAVDDSLTYLDALGTILRGEGYDVICARSGEECLEMLGAQAVDCVLLDLTMPGLSGTETCRRIKASAATRDVPLVMLTANEDRAAMLDGLATGADDYVLKSSDDEVLKARVRAQLRRKQIEDESRHMRVKLLHSELEAASARAAKQLAETRAALVEQLERKNRELDQAREKAERESRFKSTFLASMSHELRTPLNAIIGFTELLDMDLAGPLQPKQREYVNDVLQSANHLLTLINDVLDLSKIDAGRVDLHKEWVALDTLTQSVLAIVQPLANKRSVRLVIELPAGLPQIHVDTVRFKQILFNLVSNGIKFTPAGGEVSLSARVDDRGVQVAVRDTGIGIRGEDLPRLFQEFEQIEPTLGVKPEGTGLGLALTKRLVDLHGGTVAVQSEPGQGSVFTVSLPAGRAAPERAAVAWADTDGAAGARVLVVEDDTMAAQIIASHLRAAGLAVTVAPRAEDAARLAAELQPAAITLDIMMPGCDGWTVLKQLKKAPTTADIPVIVVSALDEPQRGYMLGAANYLTKPVTGDALVGTLERCGLPIRRGSDVRVLLVGEPPADVDGLETRLRGAGCAVERTAETGHGVAANADLVLVDLRSERGDGTVGIVGLAEGQQPLPSDWRAAFETLARADVMPPDHLVRAVQQAVERMRA
jgi:DNA-binding response OmpR family regulator/anti-sigma regulatory factor (Ser/Thr protein kinase)